MIKTKTKQIRKEFISANNQTTHEMHTRALEEDEEVGGGGMIGGRQEMESERIDKNLAMTRPQIIQNCKVMSSVSSIPSLKAAWYVTCIENRPPDVCLLRYLNENGVHALPSLRIVPSRGLLATVKHRNNAPGSMNNPVFTPNHTPALILSIR